MLAAEIALYRLVNQGLARPTFQQPSAVVAWLGAVQAQDYAGAKWAVGQRMQGTTDATDVTDATIEQAIAGGTILRTHVLRPTWHFVTPADIRWMLTLTAPRINALSAYYYRQLELDDALFRQSNAALAKALEGGKQLTRAELVPVLNEAGIAADHPQRVGHIMGRAELDGVVRSGALRGKQFTYALLDERVPPAQPLAREEALAQLARRYFTAHGPATLQDFSWWSGLLISDAKSGLEAVKSELVQETIGEKTYWMANNAASVDLASLLSSPEEGAPRVYLLSGFDEYLISYTDRSASLAPQHAALWHRGNAVFSSTIVIHGRVVGTWKRTFKKGAVEIASALFRPLTAAEYDAFVTAAQRFCTFVNMPMRLL